MKEHPRLSAPCPAKASRRRRARRGRFEGYGLDMRSGVSSLGDSLGGWLAAKGMDALRLRLIRLFRQWDAVLGSELSAVARPIGHRGSVLLIGCTDSCAMQELSFAAPEILERVNMFLGEEYFSKAELHLQMGREEAQGGEIARVSAPPAPERPGDLGNLDLPEDTPVGACYAAYLRMFREQDEPLCASEDEIRTKDNRKHAEGAACRALRWDEKEGSGHHVPPR